MFRYRFLLLLLPLLFANLATAASINVVATGDSSYSVQGSGMDGVAGIDLTLNYDSASLASPGVTQGSLTSGGLMAANTGKAGSIRIAIVSTKAFAGSGPIATITFAARTGSGGITGGQASMIDGKGKPLASLPVSVSSSTASTPSGGLISTPGVPFSQETAGQTPAGSTTTTTTTTATTRTTTQSGTATGQAFLGTVSMPGDNPQKSEAKPAEAVSQAVPPPEVPKQRGGEVAAETKTAPEPPKQAPAITTVYKSVLDDFRAFSGERTPQALTALFSREIAANISQQPVLAVSDGQATVSLRVKLATVSDKAPNFALNGAVLKSVRLDEKAGAWLIEALPEAGALEASLVVLAGNEIFEYPLTLVPPVPGLALTEAEQKAFFKGARRDLNGDGKTDAVDEYLYLSNYLLKGAAAKAKK